MQTDFSLPGNSLPTCSKPYLYVLCFLFTVSVVQTHVAHIYRTECDQLGCPASMWPSFLANHMLIATNQHPIWSEQIGLIEGESKEQLLCWILTAHFVSGMKFDVLVFHKPLLLACHFNYSFMCYLHRGFICRVYLVCIYICKYRIIMVPTQ